MPINKRALDITYILLVLPALLLFFLFFLIPFFRSLFISFTDQYGYNTEIHWIAFANYVEAFKDENFYTTIAVTFKYTGFVTLFGNLVALGLALIVDSRISGRNALRSIFFVPNLMSLIIVGFVWTFLYGDVYSSMVKGLGISEDFYISWLGNPGFAIYSIGMTAIWQSAGYTMIIYLAGLQTISGDVLEAAEIDGASSNQRFWKIKLPLLLPVIFMNLILSITTCLKAFDFPLAMTSGGPGYSTTTTAYYIYTLGFRANRTGYATSISVLLFIMIALATAALLLWMRSREEQL